MNAFLLTLRPVPEAGSPLKATGREGNTLTFSVSRTLRLHCLLWDRRQAWGWQRFLCFRRELANEFSSSFLPFALQPQEIRETVTDSSCNLHFKVMYAKIMHFSARFISMLKQIGFGSLPFISFSFFFFSFSLLSFFLELVLIP